MQAPGGSLLEITSSAVECSAVLLLPLHGNYRRLLKNATFQGHTESSNSSIAINERNFASLLEDKRGTLRTLACYVCSG